MGYVDKTFYRTYNPTRTVADEDTEFDYLAERASEVIDHLSMHQIPQLGGLTAFSADTQTSIKKAVAAEIDTLYDFGGMAAITGGVNIGTSLGKFSTQPLPEKLKSWNGIPLSPMIEGYLFLTGLLFRGMNPNNPLLMKG